MKQSDTLVSGSPYIMHEHHIHQMFTHRYVTQKSYFSRVLKWVCNHVQTIQSL